MSGKSWRRDGRLAVVLALVTVAGAVSCRRSRSIEPAASPAGDGQATVPRPSAAELDAYLSGAGGVHLGMTVSEVSDAFDAKPTRRQEAPSRGVPVDVVWDTIGGPRPGGALGLFEDDRLRRIEFIPRRPDLPRITQAAADTFLTGEIARRSYERTLRMSEIEAVTGPGYRATWFIDGRAGTTRVGSQWVWEVEPGGKVLVVVVVGDDVGQPVVRP
ncbi:MAG TPA: hypothetical protein VFK70_17800, partial [Vicinamibacteria bacterium]|nr:hypothetical protein [Vicinamibacteria bacterium]